MFTVQQLSDVPYMGAPYSSWYIEYDQEEKTVKIDGVKVSSKVAFDVIKDIKRQLISAPEHGHHYDITQYGNTVRIGIAGHNISISRWDIPNLQRNAQPR